MPAMVSGDPGSVTGDLIQAKWKNLQQSNVSEGKNLRGLNLGNESRSRVRLQVLRLLCILMKQLKVMNKSTRATSLQLKL